MNSTNQKPNEFQLNRNYLAGNCATQISSSHPLQNVATQNESEQLFQNDLKMLRNYEGLHAPLKLVMERNAVKHTGRLPCLPSINPHLECLSGRDETIDFTDIFGGAEFSENLVQPHAVIAKHLNIL